MSERHLLILASNSPRRRQLLALGGWMFNVMPADIDESVLAGETPEVYVARLAEAKARAILPQARPEHVVIGSDTTVVYNGEIIGKPVDVNDAQRILEQLRGKVHQVYTGISIIHAGEARTLTEVCLTDVPMRDYTDQEIADYIKTGDPMDKAGAYAIQSEFNPVIDMAGCYASVMGLPLCHLTRMLRKVGVAPGADVPSRCQSYLKYQCPVFQSILSESPQL